MFPTATQITAQFQVIQRSALHHYSIIVVTEPDEFDLQNELQANLACLKQVLVRKGAEWPNQCYTHTQVATANESSQDFMTN